MIFIANKTREIEKSNNLLKLKMEKINEDIKINKIEFITHQNSSYLEKLYYLYFSGSKKNKSPKIITVDQLQASEKNIKLVNIDN